MQSILTDLNNTSSNIQASALISTDGLVIASALPQDMNEDTLGAISAALHSVGVRSVRDLASGAMEHIMVKSSQDYIVMTQAGKEAVLTVIVKSHVGLEQVMSNIKFATQKLICSV